MAVEAFDPSWAHPSEAQQQALAFVLWRKPETHPPDLTEYLIAEMLCVLPESFVYIQMSGWAENPPASFGGHPLDERIRTVVWQRACKFAKAIVDLGYQGPQDGWWPMAKLQAAGMDPKAETINLGMFGCLLWELSHKPVGPDFESLKAALVGPLPPIIPASWWTLFDLWLGTGWEAKWRALISGQSQPKRIKRRLGR